MKIRAVLAVFFFVFSVFLVASCIGLSEAGASERQRTSFFYGNPPFEIDHSAPTLPSRQAYMAREFVGPGHRQPAAPVAAVPVDEFIPFAQAQAQFGTPEAAAAEHETQDGFIPFAQAQAQFGTPAPAPAAERAPIGEPLPSVTPIGMDEFQDGFVPFEYARARFGS